MNHTELEIIAQKHALNKLLDKHKFRHEVYMAIRNMEKAFPKGMDTVYEAADKFKGHIYSRNRNNNSIDKFYKLLYKKVNK